jgi:GNAT superfamily N-acetyltransferase
VFNTQNYKIAETDANDLARITDIYNSNSEFIKNHLGVVSVDESWVLQEYKDMQEAGFSCCKIVSKESGSIVGFIDFKLAEEAYLSLLMIAQESRKSGIGAEIVKGLEAYAGHRNSKRIRIDVVTGYSEAVMRFWMKNGYVPEREITLDWNGKALKAMKMVKELR